jgi:rubredoxin
MLLEPRSDPVEMFLYVCQEPGCFVCYDGSQGYLIDKQDADTTEEDIKPHVSCPNDGHLMYLAEVRPERKNFRLWKCPECNTIRTNEQLSDAVASSG